ncbi:MAG: TIGR00282 family metallophosphoesterase [Clostridia bacterium]|nr:TIGR00282 family metallophosphoesterase [Clostridia bacterium]
MNILFIGDIVGRSGREAVFAHLDRIKYEYDIDFTVANGENSSGGLGMSARVYEELSSAGIDCFTFGNHTFSKPDVKSLVKTGENVVIPSNYEDKEFSDTHGIFRTREGRKVAVINLLGSVYMDIPVENPFHAADKLIEKVKTSTNIILIDFHAEATSEKIALGQYLDGRVSALLGTHTHVQTNDACILPGGSAYITDAGMTGPENSVLGLRSDIAIKRFLTGEKIRYEASKEPSRFRGVIVSINDETGKAEDIKTLCL